MPNDSFAKSLGEALDTAKRRERRFWALSILWVLGAGIVLVFLWTWSGRLDGLRNELDRLKHSSEDLRAETQGLHEVAREAGGSAQQASILAREATTLASRAEDTLERAEVELSRAGKRLDALASQLKGQGRMQEQQLKEQQRFADNIKALAGDLRREQTRLKELAREANDNILKVEERIGSATRRLDEAIKKLNGLEQGAKEAEGRFQNIERRLQTAHYVFKTRSKNQVWGMDIFIRFGAWNKSQIGLNDLCVSATEEGKCLWGPEFAPLGKAIGVTQAQYRYTIIPRYAVGMLLAHDQVGFDVLREEIGSAGSKDH